MATKPNKDELRPEDFSTAADYESAREEQLLNELVPIQLIKDNENYKNDVTVQINGRIWQLQRGVPIMVPRKVANVLNQSQYQEAQALRVANDATNRNLGER